MKLTQYISLLLLTGAAASVVSCTEMDDYLRFTEGVSSTYTGKLDSAVFLAGNGRLLFHGELSSDPKVSRIGLYWNVGTKQDSLSIEVDYAKDKIVEQEIALGEGSYNFQIYTYDSAGNHSIPMTRSGNSYGANYLEGLYNRVVKSCALDGEDIAIEWYSGSENSPYTVVTYTGADGKPVKATGAKGDSFFKEVRETDDEVIFILSDNDNTEIRIPKAKEINFVIEKTSLVLKYGMSKTLAVTQHGVLNHSIAKPDGWRATLDGDVLTITAPVKENIYAEREGKVSVVAVGATATVIAIVEVTASDAILEDSGAGDSNWEEW